MLSVRGINSDHDTRALGDVRQTRQQGRHLSDLVGALGHPQLRDGDTHTVDHRGEQGDLVVVLGPGTTQNLAIQRDHQQALGVTARPFEQPRPDQQVQRRGVDGLQHPAQRRFARPLIPAPEHIPFRAQFREQRLWKIPHLGPYLTIVRRARQHRDHRGCQNEHQLVYLPLRAPRISQMSQHLQQVGDVGVVLLPTARDTRRIAGGMPQ